MGEEFKDVDVDKPIALRVTVGLDPSKSDDAPTHSIVIDRTDIVCGAPTYPNIEILDLPWWRIRERRRRIAVRERMLRDWERQYAAWVEDGKPDREVLVRTYIPNARITNQEV